MKKCILSAIAGAAAMFFTILCLAYTHNSRKPEEYKHVDFISAIDQADCYLCGTHSDPQIPANWSENNIAILDLNTFKMHRLEINRYGDGGKPITTLAGYLQTGIMETENGWLNSITFPDHGYASVQIPNVAYSINRESVENHLCQNCLDTINNMWFSGKPPAEFAVVNLATNEFRPLIKNCIGFQMEDYFVHCDFKENSDIRLLIAYLPVRYDEET